MSRLINAMRAELKTTKRSITEDVDSYTAHILEAVSGFKIDEAKICEVEDIIKDLKYDIKVALDDLV